MNGLFRLLLLTGGCLTLVLPAFALSVGETGAVVTSEVVFSTGGQQKAKKPAKVLRTHAAEPMSRLGMFKKGYEIWAEELLPYFRKYVGK